MMTGSELKPGLKKFIPLVILSAILSILVSFLATPILRVLRNVYGARAFWLSGLVLFGLVSALQLTPVAFLVLSCWVVVGLYAELEERGHAGFWAGFLSLVVASGVLIGGTWLVTTWLGQNFVAELQSGLKSTLDQLQANKPSTDAPTTLAGLEVNAAFILSQIPSVVVLLHLMNLGFALMMDRKVALILGLPFERIALHLKPLDFRVPDGFVWLAMLSFLGTFLKLQPAVLNLIASNIFTVMMGLYLFQGLAVMELALIVFRVGAFIRFLLYFIVVGQLFFVLSAVGFADYWIDFRKRLRNFRMKQKNSNNGEHV